MMMVSRQSRWRRRAILVLTISLVGLAGVAVAKVASLRAFLVPSASMSPTIAPGDRVCVQLDSGAVPQRGAIWVFRMPVGASAAGSLAVKRIVGLPGERVEIFEGQIWIDGKPLVETDPTTAPAYEYGPITLGADEYFMLGDNRNISQDSHVWGPLPADHLVGPVRYRYWPPSRAQGL